MVRFISKLLHRHKWQYTVNWKTVDGEVYEIKVIRKCTKCKKEEVPYKWSILGEYFDMTLMERIKPMILFKDFGKTTIKFRRYGRCDKC